MRSIFSSSSAAALALVLAACGSSGSSTSAGHHRARSRPSHVYKVKLTGGAETPRGAPLGMGVAIIAVHGHVHVCWRFAHLHGFSGATIAHIHRGTKGHAGPVVVPLSIGTRLRHEGCVRTSRTLTKAMVHDPSGYYVNIHSTQYPGGAVRGQL
jgi:hypothetical protein